SETWSNSAFTSSISRSERSEGTYISDIITPLLRSSLGDLLNGSRRMNGKETDIMGLLKWDNKFLCSNSKRIDDYVKLWKETLDGVSFLDASYRPDLSGIPRYFHLDHAEIPLSPHASNTKALISLLLTLRNIMVVNKSLLIQTLEQANIHPPKMYTRVLLFHPHLEMNRNNRELR
ncbi:13221_t:CDS:2, partial [Acaulospora morrowiae]